MNAKKAKMLKNMAHILYGNMSGEAENIMYKKLKRMYKNKTGPFKK